MLRMRDFRPGDEDALAEVCVGTAADGADGTGVVRDDRLLGQVLVLPYTVAYPEFVTVVAGEDDKVIGYVVAAPDTRAFSMWFATRWWPNREGQFPRDGATGLELQLLEYASDPSAYLSDVDDRFPAHLHLDLLPAAQSRGFGRRLVDRVCQQLADARVIGIHAGVSVANHGAMAFWPRMGFQPVDDDPHVRTFVKHLSD